MDSDPLLMQKFNRKSRCHKEKKEGKKGLKEREGGRKKRKISEES